MPTSNSKNSVTNQNITDRNPEKNKKEKGDKSQKWYPFTDIGNRNRFIDEHADIIKYNVNAGRWIVWNGKIWTEDEDGMLYMLVDKTIENMRTLLFKDPNAENNSSLKRHINKTESKLGIDSMIGLVKEDARIIRKNSDFDNMPNLFNCKNCTIALCKDGSYKVLTHNKENYITKISSFTYDSTCAAPFWEDFLSVIFNNDKELIKYFQKILGYLITGFTDENVLFFFYGDGANGKSTLLEIIKLMLGEYCRKAKVNILIKNKSEATGMDIARLDGARTVICSETDLGTSFDEGKIKDLTGGDTMVARRLYKDFFEFRVEFKIVLYGNNKPRIKGNDYGIRRRIKIIPLLNRIPEEKRIPQSQLINQMKDDFSGILNFILEGYRLYKLEGLAERLAAG